MHLLTLVLRDAASRRMDQYTKEVVELLQDVEKAAFVPPSQPEKVEAVVSKMTALYKRANDLQEADGYDGSPSAVMGPRVCMLTLARLQRCLLAYLRCRMERIEQVRWDLAGAMDDASKAHLSRHELSYSERCEPRAPRAPAPFPREPPRTAGPPPPVDTSPRVVAGSTSYSPSSRWRTTST